MHNNNFGLQGNLFLHLICNHCNGKIVISKNNLTVATNSVRTIALDSLSYGYLAVTLNLVGPCPMSNSPKVLSYYTWYYVTL